MCGSPAVPRAKLSPSESWSNGLSRKLPGVRKLGPYLRSTPANSASGLKPSLVQDPHQQHDGGCQQQDRLDDLHPGRREHAAESHVDDHREPDEHHRHAVGDPEQQLDERAATGHLGDQVGEVHDDRAHDGGEPGRAALHPVRDHVGERVAAGVSKRLGHQQEDAEKGDERADGVEGAVHPVQSD